MSLYSARSKFTSVVQKWLGTNKCVRIKCNTGSKFSKISLGLLYTGGAVVVHPYCSFSLRRQMAPQQTAKCQTTHFRQFCCILMKDSITNYGWIWT